MRFTFGLYVSRNLGYQSGTSGRNFCSMSLKMSTKMDDFGIQSCVVSPRWTWENRREILLLDATWYLPTVPVEQRESNSRILHAKRFDIDVICDGNSSLPHMIPSMEQFIPHAQNLGLHPEIPTVIYSANGLWGAARVWWMLRTFGFQKVVMLNGGLSAWRKEKLPEIDEKLNDIVLNKSVVRAEDLVFSKKLIKYKDEMIKFGMGIEADGKLVLDARSSGRFYGREPEPRPGLKGGHIPGSISAPFSMFINADGTLKGFTEAKDILTQELGLSGQTLDSTREIICTCGSGVTAAMVAACLYNADDTGSTSTLFKSIAIYDGSWSEYALSDAPVEKT
mmetsp:Transcript_274/g.486  ORF Transcript_274/g.486 Transcript_274/m.486 type:complete len:337 (-) Transcript_274:125-1135(-)